jgi:uncharacterized Tic20 family protein
MENESSTPPPSSSSEPPPVPESSVTPPPPSPPEIPTMVVPPPVPEAASVPVEAAAKSNDPPPVGEAVGQVMASVGKELEGIATEKNLSIFCHLAAILGWILLLPTGLPGGNILGPLILWILKKDTMPLVNEHGKEALNFQITVTGAILLCIPLIVTMLFIPFIWLAALVLSVIGTVKASKGELYRYPLTIRLVK